jgi:hypothetical protein
MVTLPSLILEFLYFEHCPGHNSKTISDINMEKSAVEKNHNSALAYFRVFALCSFLHFELCPDKNIETIRNNNMKP